jgi:hypothetical protein
MCHSCEIQPSFDLDLALAEAQMRREVVLIWWESLATPPV